MIRRRPRTAAGRRHAPPVACRLLAVAAVCLAMTAYGFSAEPRSPDPRAGSDPASPGARFPAAPDASNPQPARTFTAPQRPCTVVDQQPIISVLGPDSGNIIPPRTETRGGITVVTCHRTYGNPGGDRTAVSLRIHLADPAATKSQYEDLRRIHARQAPLIEGTSLGQGAYTYTDPQVGENLAAYDGNLYLTVRVSPIMGPAKPATGLRPMMIESAKVVMARLSQ